jgi:hypothetical protein
MNAPGKGLLKVVSILFIIFGVIATIVSLIAAIGLAAVTAYVGDLGIIISISTIVMLIASVLELVLGIAGNKKCSDPAKAGFFITSGIALCVVTLAGLILSIAGGAFSATAVIAFILPLLFIVGGIMNKKAAGVKA